MLQLHDFSTDNLPAPQRIDYWNSITCQALTTQVADPFDRQSFCGRMTSLELGDMRFVEVASSGSTVTHTRAHAGACDQALYLLRLAISGEITTVQDGQEIRWRSGDFTLCDTRRPYQMQFHEPCAVLILRIPRSRLVQYIGSPERLVGMVMPGDAGLSGLASRHLRDIWSASRDFLSQGAADRMVEMTLQLIASAYCGVPQAKADRSSLATGHRAQIVRYIETHLAEPDLAPSAIAAALKMTPGYLHRLFSRETDTISRYILRRRLERSSRALHDPLQTGRTITAIALDCGFHDLAHFSRTFRERFGASPREFRRAGTLALTATQPEAT